MIKRFCISLILSFSTSSALNAKGVDIHVFLSDIAGMSMNDGDRKGMGYELVERALTDAELTYQVTFLPWSRLVKEASANKNAIMLPISRTPEREDLYTWIRPIFNAEIGFVSSVAKIDDWDIAEQLNEIGVWQNTFFESYLRKRGFENLQPYTGDQALARLFESGRVQAWFGELNESRYRFKKFYENGRKPKVSLFFGKPVVTTEAWLVAGKEFDPALKERLQEAFQKLYDSDYPRKLYMDYYNFSEGH